MITIQIYGLDAYTVGHYSKEHTENLAQILETKKEEIVFVGCGELVFHNGVDQTSWQTQVIVSAPEKYEPLEDTVATYLLQTLVEFSIHINVVFEYFHNHHEHNFVNKDYPRYIKEDNLVNVEESEEDDELYEGNIFEGMEEKLDEAFKQTYGGEGAHHECHCEDCDEDHCDCDDDCECEEGHCHCGHKH